MMNGYVPYDVTYLTKFADTVKSAIGGTVNIGIIAFGIITAFAVVVLLAKKFMR